MTDKPEKSNPDNAGFGLEDMDLPEYTGPALDSQNETEETPAPSEQHEGASGDTYSASTDSAYDALFARAVPQKIAPVSDTSNTTAEETDSADTELIPTTVLPGQKLPYEQPDNFDVDSAAASTSGDPYEYASASATNKTAPTQSASLDTELIPVAPSTTSETAPVVAPPSRKSSKKSAQADAQQPIDYGTDAEPYALEAVKDKRGTISAGILLLRLGFGAWLLALSVQILFGLGGSTGVDGLAEQFSNLHYSTVIAVVLPVVAFTSGCLLILGLVSPFASALAFIVSAFTLLQAFTVYTGSVWPQSLLSTAGGALIISSALCTVIAFALILLGPGKASFDRNWSWSSRPLYTSWFFAILALVAVAGAWILVGGITI